MIIEALIAALAVCGAGGKAAPQSFPFEETVVVKGADVSADFAVQELNFVVSNATGRAFAVCGRPRTSAPTGVGVGGDVSAPRRVFVGRSPEAERILGTAFFEGLKDEESAVFAKGNDLFLVGGGQLGCLYAVYDFVEDNLGFRHYFKRDDGFVADKVDVVTYKGRETRNRPAFRGYRKDHNNFKEWRLGGTRNRQNATGAEALIKGYRNPLSARIPGHGFNPFLMPPYDRGDAGWGKWFKDLQIGGWYKEHPEWFSMDQFGKRVDDAQLCLSNPGCREQLLQNLIKWVKYRGAGIYMVGSNDNQNDRYCWCEGCVALEKKYDSVGGPLWDWILWACPELERRGYKDAIICSLAYKGWRQTEIAPKGVERFPDNFNCDAAFLNADRELAYAFYDTTLPSGEKYDRTENLKKWCRLCKHVSYWYYGGSNPAQVWWRTQHELRELYECGVESVGSCGTGGAYEFGDFTNYIFDRLLRDPYCDLEPDLKRIFAIKYGPAAEKVREYVDTLDAFRRDAIRTIPVTTGTDAMYAGFSFLDGRALLRLRAILDEALALTKGTPYEQHVLESRLGLNIWTITYFHKIRQTNPAAAAKIDCAALDAESRAAALVCAARLYPDEKNADHVRRRKHNQVVRALDAMANYANLKDDRLPPELKGEPADKVFRILPPKANPYFCGNQQIGYFSTADAQAVAGWAWMDKFSEKKSVTDGCLHYEVYDSGAREWLVNYNQGKIPLKSLKKGEYTLVKLGRMRIPAKFCIVMHGMWASPTNIPQPARLFDPSYQGKEWDVWMSVKVEGPKFYPEDDASAPSRIWIDQVFCVDKGVPAGK